MNKLSTPIRLDGFLGGTPQITITRDNQKVVRAILATNEKRKFPSGNKATVKQWHQLVFWGPQAEKAEQHLKKGTPLSIRGNLVQRSYKDKQGKRKQVVEVLVSTLLTPDMNQTSLFD
jgi:single-strand DNA-binding protein